MSGPCDACLRRTWLVARLAGRIEHARREKRTLREVLALDDDALLAAVGQDDAPQLRVDLEAFDPDAMRADMRATGLAGVCRHDPRYSARLTDDHSAPAVLFASASAPDPVARLRSLTADPTVAIVGTRRASPDGLEIARALGRGLAAAGVTVVSGMALGVDSAAHAGAVQAGGRSIAVLAGGADVPYPQRKRELYERLRLAGAVVSEMPPGFRPHRWCFPARNRTIAALADLTVVVEAAGRSGSLITAELALELGRDVAAVPGPVLSWRADGTNALIRDGAALVRDARDVLDLLLGVDAAREAIERPPAPPPHLSAELQALLAAVEDGPHAVDELARGSGDPIGAATVRAGLTELELLGLIRRVPGGRHVRVAA